MNAEGESYGISRKVRVEDVDGGFWVAAEVFGDGEAEPRPAIRRVLLQVGRAEALHLVPLAQEGHHVSRVTDNLHVSLLGMSAVMDGSACAPVGAARRDRTSGVEGKRV